MTETWPLWVRAEDKADAAAQGKAWADAEPNLEFVSVVSVRRAAQRDVWTVTVETTRRVVERLELGL